MRERTPTPWHVKNEESIKIKDADGDSIASMFHTHLHGRRPTNEVEANAAFIVKAVNSHDRLVEALKIFLGYDKRYGIVVKGDFDAVEKMHGDIRQLFDEVSGEQVSIKETV